jgi:hypothetical protein
MTETKICEECGLEFSRNDLPKYATWCKTRFCGKSCRWIAANRRRREGYVHRPLKYKRSDEFILDIKLLMAADNPPNIARRLGMTETQICDKLRRLGRRDLARMFRREVDRFNEDERFRTPFGKSA